MSKLELIGYVGNEDEEAARVGLGATWDTVVVQNKLDLKAGSESPNGPMGSDGELIVDEREKAVQKLMRKVFDERLYQVRQITYWPGRTTETWRGTTVYCSEKYLTVRRSDGQVF
ncbi:hypothetical protein [Rhodoferax sp.]|uniref:hypothetical protein n=1 Tax=Rhodoferax sp. TaxID=50421 RepID=UPI00275E5F6C|nr:hypothetical protein [Rhodoferax sp.]